MKTILLTLIASISMTVCAQHVPQTPYQNSSNLPLWVQMMYGSHPNMTEVREAYEKYYSDHAFEKNQHTQYYKRWMRNNLPFSDGHGNIQSTKRNYTAEANYLAKKSAKRTGDDAYWEELGPWHYDPEVAMYFQVQSPGACHIYTVEQAPSNPDIVFAGSATAGLWRSQDKGMHWDLLTRDLLATSVYAIAIDPEDENSILFGEGNGSIWKSTNAGNTWYQTGDDNFQALTFWTRDMRYLPGTINSVLAATNEGLFRSDDGGETWSQLMTGEYMEIEFHPTDNNVVYTVKLDGNHTNFYKSIDGGNTFAETGIGWPAPVDGEQKRCEISVSAAEPDNVYVLASGNENGGSGLYGIYISEDQGENFSFECCGDQPAGPAAVDTNPNILGWSEFGDGDGGQYYYDLAMDVSPNNPDLVYGAGISVWRSEDRGSSWAINAHWVTWVGENTANRYTHADVHDIKFFTTETGTDMWVASDGGLFYSSDEGDNLEPRMYGIHGTDFWGWQAGFKDGDVMLGGTYHNGTLIKNSDLYYWGADDEESGGWLAELAGDNFRGFINPGDASIGYHDGGAFRFSDDRFTRISGMTFDNSKNANTSYWWGEYGNLEWDPTCYNHLYSPVGTELWKSENGGASFELVHDFGGNKIVQLKVAPRDPNTIYVTHRLDNGIWNLHKTNDGGDSWQDITPSGGTVAGNNNKAKYIDVHATDPNKMWFIIIGNHTGNKIFQTEDGGETWTDLTTSAIDNEYVTQLVHQRGTDDGIYLGTDKAVYYKNSAMDEWELYNFNLPARTPVVFLQNFYCEEKVRAAGSRGVHQAPFYESSEVLAGFTASKLLINLGVQCEADTIRFTDNSNVICNGATYQWTVEGGVANVLDQETILVTYDQTGTYDVSLTVTDAEGNTDTLTWTDLITVVDEPAAFPLAEDFNESFPPPFWKIEDPEGGGGWEHGQYVDNENNKVAQFPNYWVDTQGQTDLLVMPAQDFSNVDNPILFFDVSHQVYADYVDGLEVWYKTDPADDWGILYSKYGTELAVEDNYTWFWYDLGGELLWRTDTVDLGALAGEECVTMAFANIGGYGNHIWVDNVNISGSEAVGIEHSEDHSWLLFPNPAQNRLNIQHPTAWGNVIAEVYSSAGQKIHEAKTSYPINIRHLSPGLYFVRLQTPNGYVSRPFLKE